MSELLVLWTAGTEAIPIPYAPYMDDCVAMVLLGCFFLSAYVLSRSRKFLSQLMKDYLMHRERASIFSTSTASDMRYLLLLILQSCVLSGVFLFCYFCFSDPTLTEHVRPPVLLGIYVGFCTLYLALKWAVYSLLGWIFFDANRVEFWMESYSTLLYYLGFSLFPFILFIIYFNMSLTLTVVVGLVLLLFTKFLIFYKWLKLFCNKLHGIFLLILYFCALEIIPCLMLYRGMTELNDYLIIKF